MFTLEKLQEATETLRNVIEVIYQYEDDFQKDVLKDNGWKYGFYSIERCHAARVFRLTLKRSDGREKDVYIPSCEVLGWVIKNQEKVLNNG